jgi:hypothetical protein
VRHELARFARRAHAGGHAPLGKQALPGEEDQDGRHDGEVREQRIGIAEGAILLALHDDVAHGGIDDVHHAERVGIEMGAAGGDLTQHDGREPRAGAGLFGDGGDPGVELVLRGAGAVGNGTGADADGAEHIAQHFHVEAVLAAVVVVDHRLVDLGLDGDAIDARAVVAAFGELASGGGKDGGLRRPGRAWASAFINQLVS